MSTNPEKATIPCRNGVETPQNVFLKGSEKATSNLLRHEGEIGQEHLYEAVGRVIDRG